MATPRSLAHYRGIAPGNLLDNLMLLARVFVADSYLLDFNDRNGR
jgi:hypothetical protein